MYNQYNLEANNSLENIVKNFRSFLYNEDIGKGSIRSYVSDVRHFLGWLYFFLESNRILKIKDQIKQNHNNLSINDFCLALKHIKPKVLDEYKNFLTSNNVPTKTINRRFSSLRRFGAFCQQQNWVTTNPFETLKNISLNPQSIPEEKYHLEKFRLYLWQKKASQITIKNYLSDIKHFINWSEKQNK